MCDQGVSSDEEEDFSGSPNQEGRGFTKGGFLDFSFCVFPSLKPPADFKKKKKLASDPDPEPSTYVPWEMQVPPWKRLAKWLHKKSLVGMLARGNPCVLVLQTNHAPDHPNRAALRAKTLMNWVSTELGVKGEIRLVLKARVEGAGFTMEQQVAASQEAEARDAVAAFLASFGEMEASTCEAVIGCLKEAELEVPSWLPFLAGMDDGEEGDGEDESGEEEMGEEEMMFETVAEGEEEMGEEEGEEEEGEEGEEEGSEGDIQCPGPALSKFIASAKEAAAEASGAVISHDELADANAEEVDAVEEEAEEGEDEAAAAAAAVKARQQLDERAVLAARMMEEGRGMGLVDRDELTSLLQRCAECGECQYENGDGVLVENGRWEDWDQALWMPKPESQEAVQPPPGLTEKQMKKWLKQHAKK